MYDMKTSNLHTVKETQIVSWSFSSKILSNCRASVFLTTRSGEMVIAWEGSGGLAISC